MDTSGLLEARLKKFLFLKYVDVHFSTIPHRSYKPPIFHLHQLKLHKIKDLTLIIVPKV